MAPEQFLRSPYDPFKADIYALGMLLFHLVTKSFLFKICEHFINYLIIEPIATVFASFKLEDLKTLYMSHMVTLSQE